MNPRPLDPEYEIKALKEALQDSDRELDLWYARVKTLREINDVQAKTLSLRESIGFWNGAGWAGLFCICTAVAGGIVAYALSL